MLIRPDLRRPSRAVKEEGPSATIFFHGGDSGLGRREWFSGVASRTRRRFVGGPSSVENDSRAWPLMPFGSGLDAGGAGLCWSLSGEESGDWP